jgi:tryptophan-rich sensory protein
MQIELSSHIKLTFALLGFVACRFTNRKAKRWFNVSQPTWNKNMESQNVSRSATLIEISACFILVASQLHYDSMRKVSHTRDSIKTYYVKLIILSNF